MPTPPSIQNTFDELLVLAWQAGRPAAGERLIERWHGRLWRHARLLTDSPEDATEALQAAWTDIVRSRGRLRHPGRFGPWAYRIVTRRCADLVRRRRRDRRATSEGLDELPATARVPDERTGPLREALDALPGDDRAMLMLVHVDGLPLRAVAEVFDIPVGTVKSRLHAIRTRLAAHIEGADHGTHRPT